MFPIYLVHYAPSTARRRANSAEKKHRLLTGEGLFECPPLQQQIAAPRPNTEIGSGVPSEQRKSWAGRGTKLAPWRRCPGRKGDRGRGAAVGAVAKGDRARAGRARKTTAHRGRLKETAARGSWAPGSKLARRSLNFSPLDQISAAGPSLLCIWATYQALWIAVLRGCVV